MMRIVLQDSGKMQQEKRGLSIFGPYKKGNAVADTITVVIVLFVLIFCIFIGKIVFTELNDDIQGDSQISDATKATVAAQDARYADLFDGLFIFAFFLIWILALVASFMVDSHPIFFIITVILILFVFIVAAFLGNAYEELIGEDDFIDIAPQFPMANWIMSNLLLTIIVIGLSVVLVLYGKNRWGS